MKIGANTKSFGGKSIREVAELFAGCGLSTAELCFSQSDLSGWRYNLCGYLSLPKPSELQSAVEVFRSYALEVSAIGVYCNFWSGKSAEIFDTMRMFSEYCDIALAAGVKVLVTHTGTTAQMPLSHGFGKELCKRMYEGFLYACIEAKKRGLFIAVETGEKDAVTDYDGFIKLKRYVEDCTGSGDVLKYVYSPESCEKVPTSEIGLCHIKDRKNGGKFYERFGSGDFDFIPFLDTFGKSNDIPMILEYVNSENLCDTVKKYKCALASTENM